MGSPPAATPPGPGVVAVTPAVGATGRAVLTALRDDGWTVIAVDTHTGPVDGVRWRLADPATPQVAEALAGVDVVVHLGCPDDLAAALAADQSERRAQARRRAQAVATAAAAVGARQLIVITSAMVYGTGPDRMLPFAEEADILDVPDEGLVGDMLEVEVVAARAAAAGRRVAVLRPAALVGPGVDTVVTRQFEAPRLLTVREHSMSWQFCHVDDLAEAVVATARSGACGPLTVSCQGTLGQREVEAISGMRRIELPMSLAVATAERLHRVAILPMPPTDLGYVVHPWTVDSRRLRELGWRPRYDNESCLLVLLEGARGQRALAARRVTRKDAAALGAAGAAVAVVGTAAVWRQARARRGRS